MSRSTVTPAIVLVAMAGAIWPVVGSAQTSDTAPAEAPSSGASSPGVYGTDAFKVDPPRDVRLPRLEVPDPANRVKRPDRADRGTLLNQTIELSDERDRRTLAREQKAWGRLSGTMCTGCGGDTRSRSRVATVDPIAVLNAKPASARFAPARQAAVGRPDRTATAGLAAPSSNAPSSNASSSNAPSSNAPNSVAARPAARGGIPADAAATAGAAVAGAAVAGTVVARPAGARAVATRPIRTRPVGEGPVTVVAATQPGSPSAARPATGTPRLITRRSARPGHALRPRFAHRRGHRSRLTTYLGRIRYSYLRWRHQRPAHRRPLVNR